MKVVRILTILFVVALVALTAMSAQEVVKLKAVIQTKKLTPRAIVVSCADGADPTGKEISYHILLVSCGKEKE